MEKLKAIWDYLDGSKTYIGTVILIFSAFYTEVLIGIWHLHGVYVLQLGSTLNWIGMTFGVTGIGHKLYKAQ